jgi:archaellum component FlaC
MKEKVFTHLSGQQKKFKEKGLSQKEKLEIKRDIEEKVEQIKARYEEMKEKYWEYFTDFNTFEPNKKKQ